MFRGVKSVDSSSLPDRGCFPGADGSTIEQSYGSASIIKIYGADGNELSEDGDGYCNVNITEAGVLNGNTSQIYAIKNPLSFIHNATTPKDWYTDTEMYQNNVLWNGDLQTKSIYDPCPSGWRVPTDGTWNDFSKQTFPVYSQGNMGDTDSYMVSNGRLYAEHVWYPIEGAMNTNTGDPTTVGYFGYLWTSNTISYFGGAFTYSLYTVYVPSQYARAYGFAVRCVQE